MINLDELALQQTHPMRAWIDRLPDDFAAAWVQGQTLPLPDAYRFIERIVVAGPADGALAGELVSALLWDSLNVPIIAVRSYDLPAYADGQSTLVILIDHTGNLEETFAALDLADARGTKMLAITSGGALADYAARSGAALWQYRHDGPARTAVSWQVGLLLGVINRLGLVRDLGGDVAEAVRAMRDAIGRLGLDSPAVKNPAKRLAGQMVERLPLIYGAGIMAAVARRWKNQLHLNAKCLALCDELPELNHTTLAGLEFTPARLATVCLAAPTHDHPRVALRQELTRREFMNAGIVPDTVTGSGESALAQAMTAIQYGDYVSLYLAFIHEVDPTPTPGLDDIRERLAGSR